MMKHFVSVLTQEGSTLTGLNGIDILNDDCSPKAPNFFLRALAAGYNADIICHDDPFKHEIGKNVSSRFRECHKRYQHRYYLDNPDEYPKLARTLDKNQRIAVEVAKGVNNY